MKDANEENRGVRPLSSALKTLAILTELEKSDEEMRLTDLTQAIGESRATVYQRLVTLMHANWIEQTPTGAYRLTLYAARVGEAALRQASLDERSVAELQELVHEVNESVSLATLAEQRVCIIKRIEAEVVVRAQVRVGTLLSLDNSSSGRVLTAYAPKEVIGRLEQAGARLASDQILEQVRKNGYAVSSGLDTPGVQSIAAPIFNIRNECVFALSIVAPVARFAANSYQDKLLRAAKRLSDLVSGK
jgi:DNA-binding IclR family transcriptional regulator